METDGFAMPMAWRIHDSVIRGELDNGTRGTVRGRLWVHGLEEPVRLELEGNACADLAGCKLKFNNPGPTMPLRPADALAAEQRGRVGDMTASRKVRVFDVPLQEACECLRRGETPPEHTANCLYLEWFSQQNGRIVVESADYSLSVSAPEWRLSSEEEQQRRQTMELGWTGFLQGLTEAVHDEQAKVPADKDAETWDEFDYEQFLRESDARSDKLMALYDRYDGHPDADAIIAREMGWSPTDPPGGGKIPGQPGPVPEPLGATQARDPDPRSEGVDWIRDEHGTPVHPLYRRCYRAGRAAWDAVDQMSEAIQNDPDISDFICQFHLTTSRLASALNGLAYGRQRREAAFIVACLKRSLGHLDHAQAALERIGARHLLSEGPQQTAGEEIAAIRQGILALAQEFRGAAGGGGPQPDSGG